MIQGSSTYHGSVVGCCEMIRNGSVVLQAEKIEYKDPTKESKMYTCKQLVGGNTKDIYLPIPNQVTRQLSLVGDCLTQSWDISSLETSEPTADDSHVYDYHEFFDLLRDQVCKDAGLDPEYFPCKFTTENAVKEHFAWYETPHNTANSKNPWNFGLWYQQPGIATFKVKSILIMRADPSKKNYCRENHISFKLAIGRNKFNPNAPKAVMHSKRTAKDIEAEAKAPEAKRIKKVNLSAAALALVEKNKKEAVMEIQEVSELPKIPESDKEFDALAKEWENTDSV